jgi:arabinosyltransferase C
MEIKARLKSENLYARWFALAIALVILADYGLGRLSATAGSTFLGFTINADDHMVYSAWIRQAMDGHLLFDNRFTTDPQPGITFHLFFLVLGWLAKLVGIPVACLIARVAGSVGVVFLLNNLCRRVFSDPYGTKLGLTLCVLGGGVGFLCWHNFGVAFTKPSPLAGILQGQLPIDVWQPEAFTFPSLLTNGLFSVSLCLILGIFIFALDARDSWKPVLPGALCFLVLMNIHSYDALLVTLVLVALAVTLYVRRVLTSQWLVRVVVMGLGALPSAAWFLHVLAEDKVFQARAATPTFSPSFRALFAGVAIFAGLAMAGGIAARKTSESGNELKRSWLGAAVGGAVIAILFAMSTPDTSKAFLSPALWGALFALLVVAAALISSEEPTFNLFLCWALVGIIAPYFPALFQRKLAMGLVIPWAVVGSLGLTALTLKTERNARNLVTVLSIVLLSATSIYWIGVRNRLITRTNVSSTTRHPVTLPNDLLNVFDKLHDEAAKGKVVVIAYPGASIKGERMGDQVADIPDAFSILIPDLNPFISGLASAYTYAGHWSETPDYGKKVGEVMRYFDARSTPESRQEFLNMVGANYVLAPRPETFPEVKMADVSTDGTVVAETAQYRLIKVGG